MKFIRRFVVLVAFLACTVCVILLLNFTAPNPTGRRYSSRMPLSTGQGTSNQIGLDGESVLADDLHLPRNDSRDQLQCVCNSPKVTDTNNCRVCIVSAQLASPFRRPDFVGPNFIAEAKNAQSLYYESRDLAEITDYVMAAKALGRPLWVFTRVNTTLAPEFLRIVRSTGGDVVPYFTVFGYVDPIDQAAQVGLEISVVVMLVAGVWELAARRRTSPSQRTTRPSDPVGAATDAVSRTKQFVDESKDRNRRIIG